MKKVRKGTGITSYTYEAYDLTGAALYTEDEYKILVDSGPDAFNSLLSESDGLWGAETHEARAVCEYTLSQSGSGSAEIQDDSEQWFARTILKYLKVADQNLSSGNLKMAMKYAFRAGVLWERALMKFAWEKDAIRGENVQKAASEGGKGRKKLYLQEHSKLLRVMRDYEAKGHSISRAAQFAFSQDGIGKSPSANRKNWYRHSPKGSV